MLAKLNKIFSSFTSVKGIPLELAFPYQYSVHVDKFQLHDLRFKELLFSREFAQPQCKHLHFTLKQFQNILNTPRKKLTQHEYVQNSLLSKVKQLHSILEQSKINLNFTIQTQKINRSLGYLQIKPADGVSLAEKDLEYIHNYTFQRQKQVLAVNLKPKKQKLTSEQQLKKDIEDKLQEKSKKFQQKMDELTKKQPSVTDKLFNRLMSLGKKEATKKFQPYFIIDQVQGFMNLKMTYQNTIYNEENIKFDSKWLYWVTYLQSNDLKKHRKRTLFDFQFWNRGNFFPIKDFGAEISQYE